eukprot:CAMPEP_0174918534 /NCGR_PEP_ID=MMETSP1355-20121228/3130_1 /TAXON_ID=464990 /ORGANISM="Hemiselmis tepida, Strain CCMP443" /LENGTH=915 /DNA_ID=CAMNT_0016163713 /DNA_START=26 /DNA_END=2770 /DNA_ORIENTATION=+
MALASAFAVLVSDHDLVAKGDEHLDLLTPQERVLRCRKKGLSVWAASGAAHGRVAAEEGRDPDDKKAREKKKWEDLYKRAAAEESRQASFGRYSSASCFVFGPEPDKDNARYPKTLRQRLIQLVHRPWFDRGVLAATVVYCALQVALSNKICENWHTATMMNGEGGADWGGEAGVVRTFYPLTECDEDDTRLRLTLLSLTNWAITLVFTAEMAAKVVAFGFALHPHSYLRDGWTMFEFIMVAVAWLQFLPGAPNLALVRLVRVLRPLQVGTRLPGMRPVAHTLLKGARPLASVVALCLFLSFLVGLVSIEFFAGGMRGRCFHADLSPARYGEPFDATVASGLQNAAGKAILCNPGLSGFGKVFAKEQPCPPSQECSLYTDPRCMFLDKLKAGWELGEEELEQIPSLCEYNDNPDPTFSMDNLGRALMTITRTLMLDNWAQTMRFLQAGFSEEASLVVFILLVSLGSWFVTHLAIATVSETYAWELRVDTLDSKTRESSAKGQVGVVQALEVFVFTRVQRAQRFLYVRLARYPAFRRLVAVVGRGDGVRRRVRIVRRMLLGLVKHSLFDNLILGVIIVNTAAMCVSHFDQGLYEDGVCRALAVEVYGEANCTGPLAPYTRRSVRASVVNGTRLLDNTGGFCAAAGNSSAACFDSWGPVAARNVTLEGACARGGGCPSMPPGLEALLGSLNAAFTVVFVSEMALKVLAMGPSDYSKSWSNLFDALIAVTSAVEVFSADTSSGVAALRSFRVLRITRIFRRLPAMRALLSVMARAVPRAVPLILLLLLFLFVAGECGGQLMGGHLHAAVCEGAGGAGGAAGCVPAIPRTNFDTLLPNREGYGGMITVLAMITGQRWSEVVSVAEAAGRGPEVAAFAVVVMLVGVYLMLSLAVAILTRTYIEVHREIAEQSGAAEKHKG